MNARRSLTPIASFIAAGATLLTLGVAAGGCTPRARVTVDPIEIKPIYISVDVNIRVDRQLDDFFAFEEQYRAPSTTQPTSGM